MFKNLALGLCLLMLAACAPSAASVNTAIAQTQAAQPTLTPTNAPTPTNTIEPSPSYTPRPTATTAPSATTGPTATSTVAPSVTPLGAVDKFALNHVAVGESGGLKIEVARAAFFSYDAMVQLDGTSGIVSDTHFKDVPIFGEFVLKITNTTNQKVSIYPDQGKVIIGNEQIELINYNSALSGLDRVGGEIFPGVTKIGGFYFGVRRTPLESITNVLYAFDAPVDAKFNKLGSDLEIVLDLSNHEFQPFDDALK